VRGNFKAALVILDGWGIGPPWGGNAIMQAKTPNMSFWWRKYPHSKLQASGEFVGLPAGTGGNSETGHLNIGAGRVIPQDLPHINQEIKSGNFFNNKIIIEAFNHVKKNSSNLHIMGLAGNGHVHSDLNHLYALLKMAKDNGVKKAYLDLFTDGRDSEPNSALSTFEKINQKITEIGIGEISFICGRSFTMDRNKNWGKISRAYNALTKGEAETSSSARECISRFYLRNISDEYIEPRLIAKDSAGKKLINDNDSLIFFNFRPDRARQISKAFTTERIKELPDRKILKNLHFVTFVSRDPKVYGNQAFKPEEIKNTISEVIYNNKLKQLHVAETEKYAHVTYFLNGGREKPWPGEYQHLVPSPKVPSYDFAPRMSADLISKSVISNCNKDISFMVINYANPDMVGHSGNYYATVHGVEAVDENLGKIAASLLRHNYVIFIIGDHGNAEEMLNASSNQPQTEHTSNPVPFIILSKDLEIAKKRLKNGALCDVAPTILSMMKIVIPKDMTGKNLISST
jgi:2,3-bisphosphoglycerate-independent phosphoglycerate mutase